MAQFFKHFNLSVFDDNYYCMLHKTKFLTHFSLQQTTNNLRRDGQQDSAIRNIHYFWIENVKKLEDKTQDRLKARELTWQMAPKYAFDLYKITEQMRVVCSTE